MKCVYRIVVTLFLPVIFLYDIQIFNFMIKLVFILVGK